MDLVFTAHQEVGFRLFNAHWKFADIPATTGSNIPVSANGYPSHTTPFYDLKPRLSASTHDKGQLALIGYYDKNIRLQNSNCTYKYDLNVDVKTGNLTTRIIIDPESSSGGPGDTGD